MFHHVYRNFTQVSLQMYMNSTSYRIIGALALFFMMQLFFTWSKFTSLDEDKMTLEAQVQMLTRKKEELQMKIADYERDAHRIELRLEKTNVQLRDQIRLLGPGRKSDPMIYFITPTHFRPTQRADMTRLAQSLAQVPNLFWIVVEDGESITPGIADIIKRTKLPHAHMNAKTRTDMKMKHTDPNWKLPRGVEQRNLALDWIRRQLGTAQTGVVYFGDDDNVYDWRLFSEMRKVNRVGIWPVGVVGGLIVETPTLLHGSITGFNAIWKPERPFPIDMAAFAFNISLLNSHANAAFNYDVQRGYQESHILESLGLSRSDLEPLADGCKKVYVWHTRTEKAKLLKEDWQRIADGDLDPLERETFGL